jgi:hypothetical protein
VVPPMNHRVNRSMKPATGARGVAVAAALAIAGLSCRLAAQESPPTPAAGSSRPVELPFAFVANEGQWSDAAKFVARRGGLAARFERDAIVLALESGRRAGSGRGLLVRLVFEGAERAATVEGRERQRALHHYFLGSDPAAWRTNVPSFAQLLYRGVKPGVDVRVREAECGLEGLEYDVELAAGADLSSFVVRCEGIDEVAVASDGSLELATALGPIRSPPPTTWQQREDGTRAPAACRFRRIDARRFGFEADALDRSRPLVIDPQLAWSTYLGGSFDDNLLAVTVDPQGFVDACGSTSSLDFPTTPGAFATGRNGTSDAVVVRFDPAQTGSAQLLWSTYFGGGGADAARSISVDANGLVTIAGDTTSSNLPTTANAFSTVLSGSSDGFLARFDPSQSGAAQLLWSTYFGGTGTETARIGYGGVDGAGVVTIAGVTSSSDLPTTAGAFSTTFGGGARDHFIARLDPSLSFTAELLYSTYLGGSGDEGSDAPSFEVDAAGGVTIGGATASSDFPTTTGAYDTTQNGGLDGYVARLSLASQGPADLLASTFLGGTKDDAVLSLRLDATGAIVVTGSVVSRDFPTTTGAFDTTPNGLVGQIDAFVSRLDAGLGGTALLYSSYLGGGSGTELGSSVAITSTNEVIIAGFTASLDFPTTMGGYKLGLTGNSDAFVVKMLLAGKGKADLLYSTYFGGLGDETQAGDRGVALDERDFPFFVGQTKSNDYPTTTGAYQTALDGTADAYLSELCLASWKLYGAGWPGTKGVPALTTRGDPVIGSSLTLDLIDSRGRLTNALLLIGWSDANTISSAGGTLLVTPSYVIPVTLISKSTALSGTLPGDDNLCGQSLYVQALEIDPGASQGISFTAGLRLILGH